MALCASLRLASNPPRRHLSMETGKSEDWAIRTPAVDEGYTMMVVAQPWEQADRR